MAINNIPLAARTTTGDIFGTAAQGQTGNFPTNINQFDEDAEISVIFPNAAIDASGIVEDSLLRITTLPAQFAAFGRVTSIVRPGGGSTTTVTFRIDTVNTARNADAITNIIIAERTPGPLGAASTHTVTALQSGFVQAIYTGDRLATNAEKRDITITFGPAGDTTTYEVREGIPIPVAGIISNGQEHEYNILING